MGAVYMLDAHSIDYLVSADPPTEVFDRVHIAVTLYPCRCSFHDDQR